MKIINFGSLNIDHVYRVPHFVRPGESLPSEDYSVFAGGKGGNQSVALSRAEARVVHAGKIGADGRWLKDYLDKSSVDTSLILEGSMPTGHAIIQVAPDGQNSIIVYGGANQAISSADVSAVLDSADAGDILLLQNELNATREIIENASRKGLIVVFNPAPMTADVRDLPLASLRYIIVNELEGAALAGVDVPQKIIGKLVSQLPDTGVVLTLGDKGVLYGSRDGNIEMPAERVKALDTTAAGDTFTGYFLAEISRGAKLEAALRVAVRAAAICVTRKGAADSIPTRREVVAEPI